MRGSFNGRSGAFLTALAAGFLTLAPVAGAAENEAKALECQAKLKTANENGIIYDLRLEAGTGAVVVFDGPTWETIDFGTKTGFVETVRCLVTMADPDKTIKVQVLDHRNNHVVGEYNGLKLTVP